MKNLLKKYSDQNPEKFNKDFIMSREDTGVLQYVQDIFKALEILNEIKVESITIETDEAQFGPIKSSHKYYKSILQSRLNRIHYKLRITPTESVPNVPILEEDSVVREFVENENTFTREGDIYLNKLIDNCFYINEGVRYYLIYQIVDNATYGTNECVSLKSLLMPITIRHHNIIATPEFMENPINLKSFEVLLFSKKINPIMYIFGKDAYNSLVKLQVKDPDNIISEWQQYEDTTLLDKFNNFFGTDIKFAAALTDFEADENRLIFKIGSNGKDQCCYISVDKEKLETDQLTKVVVGSLLDIRVDAKKNLTFTYDDIIRPWFWIDKLSAPFTKNTDSMKKFEKTKTMLISLDRLVDDATRNILNIAAEDKKNTLTIIRYILREFETLVNSDNQDLENKRLRLYEYQTYSLRKYFSDQIYRVLNSSTRSKAVLDRMFSNLSPMFIIKQTVVNELLRYYNATNEMNLYASLLKYTFRGPQSLNKTVSMEQRDLHPSYAGRLSLIAAASGDPGLSGTLTPFVEVYNNYFKKQD